MTRSVVIDRNRPEHRLAHLFALCEALPVNRLDLQGVQETLSHGIVLAVALPTHRAAQRVGFE